MAGVFGGTPLTDLQVFQRLFDDPDYARQDLPQLVESGDIEFNPVACLAVPGAAQVRALLRRGEEETSFRVLDLTSAAPRKVRTEALFAGGYRARLSVRNAQNEELAFHEQQVILRPGADVRIEPECFRLDVDVIFPEAVSSGVLQPLRIKVTRVRPRLDLRDPAANADVTVTVIGDTVANAFGVTNAVGEFNTMVMPASGPPSVTVIIEVDTENGGTATRVTRSNAGALPCGAGVSATNVNIRNEAQLSELTSLGRVAGQLSVRGSNVDWTQFVDLRRFCEAGTNVVVSGTFRNGLRLDGIESVGTGPLNDVINFGGYLLLSTIRGVEDILRKMVDLFSPLTPRRTTSVALLDNPALTTATFGKITARILRVENNVALRTLTLGAGSTFLEIRITGNPSLERLELPCGMVATSSITIRGSPRLNVAALQAKSAEC